MAGLKHVIIEIHRRSLWQVLAIYLGAAWVMMEVVDHVIGRYLLPEWVYGAAVVLLAIGFPIVLATAFVREEPSGAPAPAPFSTEPGRSPSTEDGPSAPNPGRSDAAPLRLLRRMLTWPRAILGGVLAFTALALISGFMVWKGLPRIAEARGEAGDAFAERAWIIVADFEAAAAEREVAGAARTALTIDLQQSRYVNVYSREQMQPVLRRMGLPDTVGIDRRLALEVAEREGLAAVLAPELARAGADYVFGARVLEPGTGRELIAVRSTARENRLLEGIEALSREVRARLGETADEIRRSRPLPQVTTRSLEALKLYAQADEALRLRDDPPAAVRLARDAIRLDSTFAMAHRLLAVISWNEGRATDATAHGERAQALQDRLTDRERLHVQAFHAQLLMNPRDAAEAYERILSRYPDDARAANNLGVMTGIFLGEYERAYRAYQRAFELTPYSALMLGNLIAAATAAGRLEEADTLVELAAVRGVADAIPPNAPGIAFGRGDLERADALCDSILPATTSNRAAEAYLLCGSIDVARGRLRRGTERLEWAHRYYLGQAAWGRLHTISAALITAEQYLDRPNAVEARIGELLDRADASSMADPDRWALRTSVSTAAALAGRSDLADRVDSAFPLSPRAPEWVSRYTEGLGAGARSVVGGDAERALREIQDADDTGYRVAPWQHYRALIRGLAFEGLGQIDSAIAELGTLIAPARIAIPWNPDGRVSLPFVLRRLAELEEKRQNVAAAAAYYERLLELWAEPDAELADERNAIRRALARLGDSEAY